MVDPNFNTSFFSARALTGCSVPSSLISTIWLPDFTITSSCVMPFFYLVILISFSVTRLLTNRFYIEPVATVVKSFLHNTIINWNDWHLTESVCYQKIQTAYRPYIECPPRHGDTARCFPRFSLPGSLIDLWIDSWIASDRFAKTVIRFAEMVIRIICKNGDQICKNGDQN